MGRAGQSLVACNQRAVERKCRTCWGPRRRAKDHVGQREVNANVQGQKRSNVAQHGDTVAALCGNDKERGSSVLLAYLQYEVLAGRWRQVTCYRRH